MGLWLQTPDLEQQGSVRKLNNPQHKRATTSEQDSAVHLRGRRCLSANDKPSLHRGGGLWCLLSAIFSPVYPPTRNPHLWATPTPPLTIHPLIITGSLSSSYFTLWGVQNRKNLNSPSEAALIIKETSPDQHWSRDKAQNPVRTWPGWRTIFRDTRKYFVGYIFLSLNTFSYIWGMSEFPRQHQYKLIWNCG